jgi:hypothetical protein
MQIKAATTMGMHLDKTREHNTIAGINDLLNSILRGCPYCGYTCVFNHNIALRDIDSRIYQTSTL